MGIKQGLEIEFKTEGFSELIDGLEKLVSTPILNKIVAGAIKEGVKPIVDDANGRIGKKVIGTSTPKVKMGTASIGIGPKKDKWYYVFREWGTSQHIVAAGGSRSRTKKGRSGKKVLYDKKTGTFFGKEVTIPAIPARPFMRPAVDGKKEVAVSRMARFLDLCLKALLERRSTTIPEGM